MKPKGREGTRTWTSQKEVKKKVKQWGRWGREEKPLTGEQPPLAEKNNEGRRQQAVTL